MAVNRQKGFTLVELMIGMAISLIIMAGAVYVFSETSKASLYEIRAARAMEQARSILQGISNDVRRAGYRGHASRYADPAGLNEHDSTSGSEVTTVRVYDASGSLMADGATGSCILFSYNINDSTSGAVNWSNEVFGYRYDSGSNTVKTLKSSSSGNDGSDLCLASLGSWESVSESEVLEILGFEVTKDEVCYDLNASGAECSGTPSKAAYVRDVVVSISGAAQSTGGEVFTFHIQNTIDLPNVGLEL